MNRLKPNKSWIIYGIVFVVYLCIVVFAGIHHEPWADEAQSWLIARDSNSLMDIFKAVKYEGTFATWHLIIKAFQLAGLDYDHIFVIPIVFSAIGVILLFFTDAPLLAKVMLPFSYFVVYQNAVIARQYALVFPAMMLIVILYEKRFEMPVRYHLALFFLAMTSSYGVIITCSFMLWDFICMVKNKFKEKKYRKFLIPFLTNGVVIVVLSFLSLPPEDSSSTLNKFSFARNASNALLFYIFDEAFQYVFLAFMVILFAYYFRNHIVQVIVLFAPLIIYMNVFYQKEWHMTYLYCLLVSLAIIFRDGFKKTKVHTEEVINLLVNCILVALLAVQCFTGFYSINYDYKYAYAPAKEMAALLRPYVESGATIDRQGFTAVAVSPYFDHSIFSNDTGDKAYYVWSNNARNGVLSEEYPDVVVTYQKLEKLDEAGYDTYEFESHMIFKLVETEAVDYVIYVKKTPGPKADV